MRPRQIAPEYSFRFTTQDIHATYGSADGAFARGDFLNAAQWAPAGSELKGCFSAAFWSRAWRSWTACPT